MHYAHSEYFRSVRAPESMLKCDPGVKGYYKLIDAQDSAIRMYLPHTENGKAVYNHHSMYPRTRYNTHMSDSVFMDALKKARTEVDYTQERQAVLDSYGIAYEIKVCKVCGGKRQKLIYCPVEVINESD